MRLLVIAWRNLWRTPRRTVVTVAAITLALFVMVLYSSLIEGFMRDLEKDIVDIEVGDLQIHADGYRDAPSIYTQIEKPEALIEALEGKGFRAAPRLLAGGLVASGDASAGAALEGLEIERDETVSQIHTRVEHGEWLDADDPNGVVLGIQLARTLAVAVGDELIVLSQATDGSIANDLYHVRGVLDIVSEGTDRTTVLMTEGAFRELFMIDQGVHQLLVRRPLDVELDVAAAQVAELAGDLETLTWRQLLPTMASYLDSARAVIQMVFVIVYLAIAILILNAMLMAVFERIRELGVLKALGLSPGRVFSLVLVEGLLQTAIATVLGLSLAAPGLWYLQKYGVNVAGLAGTSVMGLSMKAIWYGAISVATIAGPVVILLTMVLLAILYPGLKAARLEPIEAMRHR